ncbi:terminase large subunit domain-containing protein [Micromonospora sp. NPDC050417]|uniref:terminase large subunit domain-containing protein n=1 Tax=Micromonospora sp. NPDC050417 TaxID=3364280 RepID=UPI0037B2AC32
MAEPAPSYEEKRACPSCGGETDDWAGGPCLGCWRASKPSYYRTDPRMAWVGEVSERFLRALTAHNGPIPLPERTLGPQWVRWIQTNCRMGEGDAFGCPPVLIPEQRALIHKLAEIRAAGRRRYSWALVSFGKGGGKSPLGGWIGSVDLAGPSVTCKGCGQCTGGFRTDGIPHAVRRASADVINMASSYEQADLILDEIRVTFEEGPLAEHAKAMKGLVQLKGARGKARRIPATPKKADGSKATTLLVDEVHEMTSERQETAYDVASGGTAKREDGLTLLLSTAGDNLNTLFGRLISRFRRGDKADHELVLYMSADGHLNPLDDDDIAEGIRQANPLAAAGVANIPSLVSKFKGMPMWRALRYYWNRWTSAGESWLPAGAWDACKGDLVIDPSLRTYVGADMALKRDSAAVVVVQELPDGRLQAWARIWFPDGALIDQTECDDYIRSIHTNYNVVWIAGDEAWWPTLVDLEREGLPIFRMPQQGRNMVIAYAQTYRSITSRGLVHDGAPDFADQIASAAPHSTDRGWTLKKGRLGKRIDAGPALAGAIFATTIPDPEPAEPERPRSQVF